MLEILRLTPLGAIHTAISLLALSAGIYALVRHKEILPGRPSGVFYAVTTVLTCLTGFGIFQHGGFGVPHVLGVITLLVLALATVADKTTLFGRASYYVVPISYSTTYFFHLIPAINETATRLPIGAPLASGPESPVIQAGIGIAFLLYLVGITLQTRSLRAARPA